jgi:hypothetical protein
MISVQGVLLTFGIIFTLLNILNAVIFSVGFEMLPQQYCELIIFSTGRNQNSLKNSNWPTEYHRRITLASRLCQQMCYFRFDGTVFPLK